ncbi:unnamed protein product [Gordionus sp. m RMFG-2023]
MGWIGSDENLQFLLTLVEEKTDIPFTTLQQHCRIVYSGSITHRILCLAIRMSCMANCNTTLSSYFLIISDTASKYAKSGLNYNLCFQLVFLYAISHLSHLYTYGLVIRGNWAVTLACSSRIWQILDNNYKRAHSSYAGIDLGLKLPKLTPLNAYSLDNVIYSR